MYLGSFDSDGEMSQIQDYGIFDIETCPEIENCIIDGDSGYMHLRVDQGKFLALNLISTSDSGDFMSAAV